MTESFIQRYPWLGYLFLAAGCLAVAESAYYVDTAYANGYNTGYNDSWHIAYEQGVENGRDAGYDLGFEQGTQQGLEQGRNATLDALEQGDPAVLFRIDAGNNRSIAYAYPEANFSYQCSLSKAAEWQVGGFTYLYNGTTQCELRHTDLTKEWNEAGFSDVNLARQAEKTTKSSRTGRTAPDSRGFCPGIVDYAFVLSDDGKDRGFLTVTNTTEVILRKFKDALAEIG